MSKETPKKCPKKKRRSKALWNFSDSSVSSVSNGRASFVPLQDVLRLDFTMDDYALKGALEDDAIIDRVLDTEKVFSSCQIWNPNIICILSF